jgi:type II secretory pathway pseudopilin PulG
MLQQLLKRKVLIQPRFKKSGAGFTLVEIMVIVAITALIATIILASMGESRKEAKDAAIKTSLAEIRKTGELLYHETASYVGVCDPSPVGDNTLSDSGDFGQIEDYIEKQGGIVFCREEEEAYAVISTLNRSDCWCIDSLGDAREITLSEVETCQSRLITTICPN